MVWNMTRVLYNAVLDMNTLPEKKRISDRQLTMIYIAINI